MRALNTSVTMDSNPEGVNQYTQGGVGEAKEAKHGAKELKQAHTGIGNKKTMEATKDAAKASKEAEKKGTAKANKEAANAHADAARQWRAIGGPDGDRMAEHHEMAAHEHTLAFHALQASGKK